MSDLTWYSRLTVWVGALVLLIESVTGRSLGLITVLAVLALAFGLIVFVAGLVRDARAAGKATIPDGGPSKP